MRSSERETMIRRIYELGFRYEREQRGCAQCTVKAIQDGLGVVNDQVYKAASGLAGGGGGCTDGQCGSYSGAIMMVSLFFGRALSDAATTKGDQDKSIASRMASVLHDRYLETYGTVICSGIQEAVFGRSFDLRDEREKQEFLDAGAHTDQDKCCAVVADGARWAAELLLDELAERGLSLSDFQEIAHQEQER